jgi:hypothetical protein
VSHPGSTQIKHYGYMKQNTTSGKTGYKSENVVGEGLLYCLVHNEKCDDIPLDFVALKFMLYVSFH